MTKKLDSKVEEQVLRLARLGCCGTGDGPIWGIQLAYSAACGELDLQPQHYQISVGMNAGTPDKGVPGSLSSPIAAPFWCHDVNFQIRQLGSSGGFAGSVFASMQENQYAQNSKIDAEIRVVGGYSLPWLFNGGASSPIESLARWVNSPALSYYSNKKDFLLYFPQEIKASFIPRIQLPDANTQVILSFNGLQLGFQKAFLSASQARAALIGEFGLSQAAIMASVMMPGGVSGG